MATLPVVDRRVPADFDHVVKYPGSALRSLQRTATTVEKRLSVVRRWVDIYNQLQDGACVGMGESFQMSILNRRVYDAFWLYHEAQGIDEYPDTPPAGGTSLRAGYDILRDKGHRQLWDGTAKPPKIEEGIVEVNRWLTTVDEIRTAIGDGRPVCLGVNWYTAFDAPSSNSVREYWIGKDGNLGSVRGGHCICCIGASDRRQAVLLRNSWGRTYPAVWIPYTVLTRLLAEQGEAAIVVDR